MDHLVGFGGNGFILIGQVAEKVILQLCVGEQFHLFRIDQHQLDLRRVLLVQQVHQDGVDAYRLTLTGRPRNEQVRHFRQIGHKDLVADRLSERNGQVHFSALEFLRHQHLLERNDLLFLIRHLDPDSPPPGDGCDDPNTEGRQRKRDVVFQVFDLGNAHPGSRNDLVQGNGRPDRRPNFGDLDLVIEQRLDDLILVRLQLCPVHLHFLVAVIVEQGQHRVLVTAQFQGRVVGFEFVGIFLLDHQGLPTG